MSLVCGSLACALTAAQPVVICPRKSTDSLLASEDFEPKKLCNYSEPLNASHDNEIEDASNMFGELRMSYPGAIFGKRSHNDSVSMIGF